MKLKELIVGVEVLECHADPEMEIKEIAYDSRKVTEGAIFAAISGLSADGNRFIPMAMEKGAAVVLTEKRPETKLPYVLVAHDRLALSQVAANFYGHPAKEMVMVGITGTNGKTSSTLLLKQVLETTRGMKVGLIGTMSNWIGDREIPTERTTPENLELQQLLRQMRDAGCDCCVMEVSSHALSLERVGGIHYDVAAFTNLTEDHLDFHKTMEEYCDAKAMLFSRCDKGVLTLDDAWYGRMSANATCRILTTSLGREGDLRAEDPEYRADGVCFTAVYKEERVPVFLPIPGRFTVYNGLTVMGICLQMGIGLEEAAAALGVAAGIRGRMEVVPTPGKPYTVVIDYSHTPDSLLNVLRTTKELCKGRVIVVFGCGGDRDSMKRPIMGKIAQDLADYCMVTSDNPRSEDPMAIIRDILSGMDAGKGNYEVEEDRPTAIHKAMAMGRQDDIIVLAGKGHETYQEVCGMKRHMDEREIVADFLAKTGEENG